MRAIPYVVILIVGALCAATWTGTVNSQVANESGAWAIVDTRVGVFKLDKRSGMSYIFVPRGESGEWRLVLNVSKEGVGHKNPHSESAYSEIAQYIMDHTEAAKNAAGEKIGVRVKDTLDRDDCSDIRKGDIITKVNGVKVFSPLEAWGEFANASEQQVVVLEVVRDGKDVVIRITPRIAKDKVK
ncbi:MAG: hypothetical protein IT461_17705 [Planctomycetes bacterium]|jgi:DNA helicase TIP49 (TBP-interacting protein)|nr:hypothetical protein [Planctomycetota bacterium]